MAVGPGDILGTRYRVDALIGRGGMGHVFAATDLGEASSQGAPSVAIKVVNRLLFDETLMARLRREAEAAARIRSEYVPRVLEIASTDEREMFLVMERLVGEPLSQRMRDKGPLRWGEVAQVGEDILRGLIDAHTAGVVHRDLKPSNVFLALKKGRVRAMVLDFGVCKMDTVDPQHLTGTGESIGTVAYMAPEQIRGASKVDDRADLYAFGVLVFEMLCGRLPHDGPSQMAILASKLENDPARLRDCARVPVPEGLDALVSRALIRNPAERFASAQELLKAWRKLGAPGIASTSAAAPSSSVTASNETRAMRDVALTVTRVDLRHATPTPYGSGASVLLVDEHPTATALGGSLRKETSGRMGFGLAALAALAGGISVAVFFARGPEGPARIGRTAAIAEGAPISNAVAIGTATLAAPASESASVDPGAAPASSEPLEVDGERAATDGASAHATIKSEPRRPGPRVRSARPTPAPKSSAPHITSQPRY